jgi:hypothetical protein
VIPGAALGPGVVQGTLGLFLLPTGRPGLVLAATGAAVTTWHRRHAKVQAGFVGISHGGKMGDKKP